MRSAPCPATFDRLILSGGAQRQPLESASTWPDARPKRTNFLTRRTGLETREATPATFVNWQILSAGLDDKISISNVNSQIFIKHNGWKDKVTFLKNIGNWLTEEYLPNPSPKKLWRYILRTTFPRQVCRELLLLASYFADHGATPDAIFAVAPNVFGWRSKARVVSTLLFMHDE